MRIDHRAAAALLLLLVGFAGFAVAQSSATRRPLPKSAYGIVWQPSLAAALERAATTKKPVFLLRLLGELEGPC